MSYFPVMAKPTGSHSFLLHINNRGEYVCYSIGSDEKPNSMAVGHSLHEMCLSILREVYPNAEMRLNNEEFFFVQGFRFVDEACAVLNSKKSSTRKSLLMYIYHWTSRLDRWIRYDGSTDTFLPTAAGIASDKDRREVDRQADEQLAAVEAGESRE